MMPLTGTSWRPILESPRAGQILAKRDHVLMGNERTDVARPHNQGYPIRGLVTADFLYLHNYESGRWPAGNPEAGYLETGASPTKSLILELGRKDRSDRFWQLNFGMRPADELYDLRADPDCVRNVAGEPDRTGQVSTLRGRMESALKEQGDPRMSGQGRVFDEYKPSKDDGLYEKLMRGEPVVTSWVDPTDFEKKPVAP